MEIRSVGVELFHAGGRTDTTNLIVFFFVILRTGLQKKISLFCMQYILQGCIEEDPRFEITVVHGSYRLPLRCIPIPMAIIVCVLLFSGNHGDRKGHHDNAKWGYNALVRYTSSIVFRHEITIGFHYKQRR
jgi:hypothetical protein